METTTLNDLPPELLVEVLRALDARSRKNLRAASRAARLAASCGGAPGCRLACTYAHQFGRALEPRRARCALPPLRWTSAVVRPYWVDALACVHALTLLPETADGFKLMLESEKEPTTIIGAMAERVQGLAASGAFTVVCQVALLLVSAASLALPQLRPRPGTGSSPPPRRLPVTRMRCDRPRMVAAWLRRGMLPALDALTCSACVEDAEPLFRALANASARGTDSPRRPLRLKLRSFAWDSRDAAWREEREVEARPGALAAFAALAAARDIERLDLDGPHSSVLVGADLGALCPRLRDLSCAGVLLANARVSACPLLRSLIVRSFRGEAPDAWAAVWACADALRSLRLAFGCSFVPSALPEPVSLPRLRRLEIEWMSGRGVGAAAEGLDGALAALSWFLACASAAPHLRRAELVLWNDHPGIGSAVEARLPLAPEECRMDLSHDRVRVVVRRW